MSEEEKKKQEELAAAEKAAAEKVAAEKAAAEKAAAEKAAKEEAAKLVRLSEGTSVSDPEKELERIKELIEASNLPAAAKELVLDEVTAGEALLDEDELQTRIDAEIQYVKALTGSGKPNMPPTQPTEQTQVTTEEVDRRRSEANAKWLRTRAPVAEVTND